jgi:integrase
MQIRLTWPANSSSSDGRTYLKRWSKIKLRSGEGSPNNLVCDDNRLVAQAGLTRIRIHDQRHTHASLLLQAGYDIKVVSARLGHAKTSTTMDIYHHVTEQQHIEAGDGIGALLFGPGDTAVTSP